MSNEELSELNSLWYDAQGYIERGNFDKAIEIYKYILVRYGDNTVAAEDTNAYLGEILLMLGNTDSAENHIRKALSYNSEKPHYHHLLGFIYYKRCEWGNAVQEYKLAFDKEPWNREYLRALGEATFNSGDKKKGIEYLYKVALLNPDNSGMLTELATAYMSLDDIESARLYAEKAVAARPDDIMAWIVMRKIRTLGNGLNQFAVN